MARRKDRQFSEGDGLFPADLGTASPEAGERMPAWARKIEEDALEKETPSPSFAAPEKNETEEEEKAVSSPETDSLMDASLEDDSEAPYDLPLSSDKKAEAQEAWNQEAKKVESSQGQSRARRDTENAPRAPKGKKAAPTKKGKKKKQKSTSKANDRRGFLKTMAIVFICAVLFLMVAAMVLSNFVSSPWLALPRRIISGVVTPVQSAFSGVTDAVVDYLRKLKIRGNIEYEYEQLLIRLDEMANETAIAEELRRENEELRSMVLEQQESSHQAMNPLGAQVIGTVGNNYFSTLTLNVGTRNGVADYMAVVSNGGLVGVTYNTREKECNVRCIIDSDCTVAGLVQSSRDQGSVKGTLGTGEPMCRMYYLPDNSLPRPGDVVVTSGVGLEFPKGIPIGYIRESTRGMEDNKSYVVLEPVVDFQHLEYVTVYRYRPSYAESAQDRTSTSQTITLETLATARPVPTFQLSGLSDFMISVTPEVESGLTPAPEDTIAPAASATPTPAPGSTQRPANLEYVVVDLNGATASPTPRPTFTPTPSPVPTPDPGALTVEDDE